MAAPATTGQLRIQILDMLIGDYIVCNYQASSGAAGTFSNLGGTVGSEIPLTGSDIPNGSFYFIKVDHGFLVADRVVQYSISWDSLNTGKLIQGKPFDIGMLRSLTGGVAYADVNGNISLTTKTSYGAFPINNEHDAYIMRNNLKGTIIAGDNNVWHHTSMLNWCQNTPANGAIRDDGTTSVAINTSRICRSSTFDMTASSNALSGIGFRPAFEYKEA